MDVNSLKHAAQDIPPDIIGLASKLDLDNINIYNYFFLRNILKINTELKYNLLFPHSVGLIHISTSTWSSSGMFPR